MRISCKLLISTGFAVATIGLLILFTKADRWASASVADYILNSVTLISHEGGRVEWSQDGEWIYTDHREADGFFDVYRMRPDGTERQCLTCNHPSLPNLNQGQAADDASGNYVVFQAEQPGHAFPNSHGPSEPGSGVWSNIWVLDMRDNSVYQLNQVSLGLFVAGGVFILTFQTTDTSWHGEIGKVDPQASWAIGELL